MKNAIEFLIDDIYNNAEFLNRMACIYPGDPTGSLTIEAELLRRAAGHLESVNWWEVIDDIRDELPKVEVTYDD